MRSYYSTRSLCENCAKSVDSANNAFVIVVLIIVGLLIIFFVVANYNSKSTYTPSSTNTFTSEVPSSIVTGRVLSKKGLNMRSEPNSTSSVTTLIPYSSSIKVIKKGELPVTLAGRKGTWLYVEYAGYKGYVFSGFVELK